MAGTPAVPGLRKAAILMVVLGEEAASQVYRQLTAEQVERITREISTLHSVDSAAALSVLQEFEQMVAGGDAPMESGLDYANKLLIKAFGEDRAQQILQQGWSASEAKAARLESLQKA